MEIINVENIDSDVECSSSTSQQDQNPWPHLNDFFKFKSKKENNIVFQCKLCMPKTIAIKAHMSSFNNLKQHIKRTHASVYLQFEEYLKAGSARGRTKSKFAPASSSSNNYSAPANKRPRQQSIGESLGCIASGTSVLQSNVERCIVNLFVENMIPLHVVESDSFEKLLKTLNPTKNTISRRTLGRRIIELHAELKNNLIKLLDGVNWVATTADCWSAHHKSYLGMTVHWIDPINRKRMHAALACKRIRGVHSYDKIAQEIINIHYEFHIDKKVSRTTTDNGSNFVKAFVQFGIEADTLTTIVNSPLSSEERYSDSNESEEEDDIEYIILEDVRLSYENATNMELPVHMRCAAHTFNLIASKDADDALYKNTFKLPYRTAMAKARALWNQQSRSTQASDSIICELGQKLVVPNSTRWNSTYDAVLFLNGVFQGKRAALHRVMVQFGIQYFTDQDVLFMEEYAKVMSPVAKALDHIQGEDRAYLGTLLPTVAVTVLKLREIKELVYCSALVNALISGVERRFGYLFEDEECQLAAAFHPKFRLFWLEKYNNGKVAGVKRRMEAVVEESLKNSNKNNSNNSSGGSSSSDESDDFFSAVTQKEDSSKNTKSFKNKSKNLVKTWLDTKSKDSFTDSDFMDEPVFIELFIKYNTSIPSSAAVERLFSTGKDILKAKRSSLSDINFNMLLFSKGNMHLMHK